MPWYLYDANGTNVSDPNQYTNVGSTPPSCGITKLYLCAIQANDNMGHPIFNNINQFIEIANAVNSRTESPNVKLRPTP